MKMDSAAVEIDGSVMEGVSTRNFIQPKTREELLLSRAYNMLTEG